MGPPSWSAGECVQVAAEYVGLRLQFRKYRGAGDRQCCHGRVGCPGRNERWKGQKEPACMCALIIHHNILSGFSSRRKGPQVSAGSRMECPVCTSDGWCPSICPTPHPAATLTCLLTGPYGGWNGHPQAWSRVLCPHFYLPRDSVLHVSGTLVGNSPLKLWSGRGLPRSQSWRLI